MSPYTFRYSFASHLLLANYDIHAIQRLLCLAKAPLDTNDKQGSLILNATLSGTQPLNK